MIPGGRMAVQRSLEFSALLRHYRRARRLTQEDLAGRAGVSVHAVSDLERGVYLTPHQSTVDLLADALELSVPEREPFFEAARSGGPNRRETGDAPIDSYGGPDRPLIGRAGERSAIEQHLASRGSPLLLLSGEPDR